MKYLKDLVRRINDCHSADEAGSIGDQLNYISATFHDLWKNNDIPIWLSTHFQELEYYCKEKSNLAYDVEDEMRDTINDELLMEEELSSPYLTGRI